MSMETEWLALDGRLSRVFRRYLAHGADAVQARRWPRMAAFRDAIRRRQKAVGLSPKREWELKVQGIERVLKEMSGQ